MASNGSTIFIVDDDPLAVKVMTAILEGAGHRVSATTDSVSAFDKILEEKPECIICDLMMPEVDGLHLCKRIRATPELENSKWGCPS